MVGHRLFFGLVAATAFASQGTLAAFSEQTRTPGVVRSLSGPSSSNARIASNDEDVEETPGPNIVPKAYIIELESKAKSLDSRSTQGTHAQFHKRAAEEDLDYRVRQEFTDASLFHGLSIELESEEDKAALEALPEVKRVWPVVEMTLPKPVGVPSLLEVNATADGSPGEGYSTEIIRGENYKIDYNLKLAGVEHLHSHGFKGKGVKIAIIDSGVDYNHPALGGGFGPGKKVAFGRNYVADGQGGADDPIAACHGGGHGTHVAGTIAGQDPKDYGFGLLGVAPEATLGMYRVFSCGGGASNDVVMQSMMDAYNDGADIVSMSLGSDNGFEDADPFDQIITNAKKRGIATIVAAGNAGFLGPVLTGSPAIAKDAIAVASMDAARYPTTYKMKSNIGREEWRYSSLWPLEGDFTVFASADEEESYGCNYNFLLDAVAEVEKRGWDIGNTFYMARQSTRCDVGSMMINAVYQGFKGVIWWRGEEFANPYDNDYPSSIGGQFLLGLDHIDGPKLYKTIISDPIKFRARFSDKRFLPVENPSAGFTSNYSTFGNSWEYNVFKPLLAAPGHLILSTWPLETGGYAIISGTSMATPFVSGCFALMKQAFPKLSVEEITNLLSTTSAPAKWWGEDGITHAVSHQGAGTINVWNAYNSGTKFEEGTVNVGQTSEAVSRNITFTNTLGRSKTFDITHVPAGLMQRTPYADIDPVGYLRFGFPSKPIYAEVEFETPTTVTLGPGESTTVSFVITPPSGLDPDTIPQFSGYIRFVSGRDVYSVPYQGLTYEITKVPVLERDIIPDHPQLPAMAELNMNTGDVDWVDDDSVSYNTTAGDYPTMVYFARQPYYAFRLDLVAANTTFEPTYYGFDNTKDLNTTTPDLRVVDTFGGVDSLAHIFEFYYMEPTYHTLSWWGGLEDEQGNEELVPVGDYRWLLRLLPIETNYNDAEKWESWLGPILKIVA